jgi:aryl-alcohol dehydrogenase-like predicted oxidoreductase
MVDLMYLHGPPEDTGEMNRVIDVFCELREEGKLRGIGASIKGPNVTDQTQQLCRQYIDSGRIDAIQLIFSIVRQANREVFEPAHEAGVALVGRTCLESGFLTAKYEPGHEFAEGDHRNRWPKETRDELFRIAKDLEQEYVEPPYGSLAQVALRFCLDQEGLATIIPGAKDARQARANTEVADLPPLPDEVHRELRDRFEGRDDLGNII